METIYWNMEKKRKKNVMGKDFEPIQEDKYITTKIL